MMKILKKARHEVITHFERSFEFESDRSAGFSFPCDKFGNVEKLEPVAQTNFEACLKGMVDGQRVIDKGILSFDHNDYTPAIGRCEDLGKQVELLEMTNTCVCGPEYNAFGQRLAPRSQWGEETRESLADILGPYGSDED